MSLSPLAGQSASARTGPAPTEATTARADNSVQEVRMDDASSQRPPPAGSPQVAQSASQGN